MLSGVFFAPSLLGQNDSPIQGMTVIETVAEDDETSTITVSVAGGGVPENITVEQAGVSLNVLGYSRESAVPGSNSAFLFMIDTSEASVRRSRVQAYKNWIKELYRRRGEYREFAVFGFDEDLDRAVNFPKPTPNSTEMDHPGLGDFDKAVDGIKVEGLKTWIYKNLLEALDVIELVDAEEKAIVILSDGKSEDEQGAYEAKDVVAKAKELGVRIIAINDHVTAGAPKTSMEVQRLFFLANETGGRHVIANPNHTVPAEFNDEFFTYLENRLRLRVANLDPDLPYTLTVHRGNNQQESIVHTPGGRVFNLPPWLLWVVGGILVLVVLLFIVLMILKSGRREESFLSDGDRTATAVGGHGDTAVTSSDGPPLAYLNVVKGENSASSFKMTKDSVTIGRAASSDILLTNDSVSSSHATIRRRSDGVFSIHDLEASNWVVVNGKRVTTEELKSGDQIEIGEVFLEFVAAS